MNEESKRKLEELKAAAAEANTQKQEESEKKKQIQKENEANLKAFIQKIRPKVHKLLSEILQKVPSQMYYVTMQPENGNMYRITIDVTAASMTLASLSFEGNSLTAGINIVKSKKNLKPEILGTYTPETLTEEVWESAVVDFYTSLFKPAKK